jgi:hypothetical protein
MLFDTVFVLSAPGLLLCTLGERQMSSYRRKGSQPLETPPKRLEASSTMVGRSLPLALEVLKVSNRRQQSLSGFLLCFRKKLRDRKCEFFEITNQNRQNRL